MATLNNMLRNWRAALIGQKHLDDETREELESHLLDELTSLTPLPLNLEERFLLANHRLGGPELLNTEFGKNTESIRADVLTSNRTACPALTSQCSAFSNRLMALIFDTGILVITIFMIKILIGSLSVLWLGISIMLMHTVVACYQIIPNCLYGGSFGKLLVGIRVKAKDGSPVTLKQSILRSSPYIMFAMFALPYEISLLQSFATTSPTNEFFLLNSDSLIINPGIILPPLFLLITLIWHCFSTSILLSSPLKQAPHDLLAGTIVMDGNT